MTRGDGVSSESTEISAEPSTRCRALLRRVWCDCTGHTPRKQALQLPCRGGNPGEVEVERDT